MMVFSCWSTWGSGRQASTTWESVELQAVYQMIWLRVRTESLGSSGFRNDDKSFTQQWWMLSLDPQGRRRDTQVYAAKGYAVLKTNYRGSSSMTARDGCA